MNTQHNESTETHHNAFVYTTVCHSVRRAYRNPSRGCSILPSRKASDKHDKQSRQMPCHSVCRQFPWILAPVIDSDANASPLAALPPTPPRRKPSRLATLDPFSSRFTTQQLPIDSLITAGQEFLSSTSLTSKAGGRICTTNKTR